MKSSIQSRSRLKNGIIKYKFKRILLDENLDKKYLFTHNEIYNMLKNWNGSINQSKKHLLLASNYPWLFNSRNEINKSTDDLKKHKILPIICLSEIGRKSLTALKNIILHDKYAHFIELLSEKGVLKKWSKDLSKVQTATKNQPCLVHGMNIMMKKKIMYTSEESPSFINCYDIIQCIYTNEDTSVYAYYLQALAYYQKTHQEMENKLNSIKCIHFIRQICEIVLGNNRKLISYLQGKESAVRTAVPKRVLSCRAQISLAPYLKATQIGLPYWWAKYINFKYDGGNLKIINANLLCEEMPANAIYKLYGQRIIAKRDPIIHILAFCVFDEVYFHSDSRCKIGAESLKKTASDFDGDTWIFYFTDDLQIMYELDYNASPRFNMALHGQCRINLIESIVLAMYKRDVAGKIPHWRLYNFIRSRYIYSWMMNKRNCSTLDLIHSKMVTNNEFSLNQLYNMIEPTDTILSEVIIIIHTLFGSVQSYKFYCEILRLTMELSLKFKNSKLYQEDLPCNYTLTNNLLNFDLLAASLSCAKGNIHTYKSLLDKVYDLDKTCQLVVSKQPVNAIQDDGEEDDQINYENLISDITNANIFAAKKSKQVPQQGYNLFKDTIEGDLMNFGKNNFNYDGEVLIENLYLHIPLQYILRPSIAYSILYKTDLFTTINDCTL